MLQLCEKNNRKLILDTSFSGFLDDFSNYFSFKNFENEVIFIKDLNDSFFENKTMHPKIDLKISEIIANGYNWPEYSREKLTSSMICHHFRMFTARAWNLTLGFDESITNAVDYDMYLKLSEVGPFKHINKICYNRVLHGENTSIKKLGIQKINHFAVVNAFLKRQQVNYYDYTPESDLDSCRKYQWIKEQPNVGIAVESNRNRIP